MLKFATLTSDIELPFYTALASLKIDHDKLDDSSRRILGLYEIKPTDIPDASCRLQIHGNSLTNDVVAPGFYRAEGMIKNVNTIEDYRNVDKTALLTQAGRTVWDAIGDGTIYSCPSLLASFVVICFADLKKYKFTYLFGFPALHSEPAWYPTASVRTPSEVHESKMDVKKPALHLSANESAALVESVQTWRCSVDARQYGFFLAKRVRDATSIQPGGNLSEGESQSQATTPEISPQNLDFYWVVGSLAKYESGFFEGVDGADQFTCFADPSTYEEYPGWMLRNLLILVRRRWRLNKVQVLCYRDIHPRREDARSLVLHLTLNTSTEASKVDEGNMLDQAMPRVSGWERSDKGKVSSKIASLGEYMDPKRLADQAVDLNLKLIKWRISPGLDLDIVKRTKCLLLGAGTLGSYVARNLLGWGVRKITFVDNGSVSFSNPVRQPLFNFRDCLGGGVKKAHRAAEALKEIYPGVDAEGHVLSVPMAGHPILDEPAVAKDYETLARLIHEHDAIFLLMDTRESRWLPTVMGKAAGKIVMNAALGFDSFVVMRHGGLAPAPTSSTEDRGDHPLGVVPHQVRGFLSTFQNLVIKGSSYDYCSACSSRIIDTYKFDEWQFVKRALNEKDYVEELSGLSEVHRIAEKALATIEFSDDSDDEGDDKEPELI
ncbi:MAG: hypothetical protein Q9196_001258 [Gyalolechia fulgens]